MMYQGNNSVIVYKIKLRKRDQQAAAWKQKKSFKVVSRLPLDFLTAW